MKFSLKACLAGAVGRPLAVTIAAVVAVAFGLLTVVEGGRALFGGAEMGAIVPFVLRFNFAAGFAYVVAGIGLWYGQNWARMLSMAIAAATAVVLAGFLWHVWHDGAYETRTMVALPVRLGLWIIIAAIAIRNRPFR